MQQDQIPRRWVVRVPSLAFLILDVLYILAFLLYILPIHRKSKELVLQTGWDIPARSSAILSIPPGAHIALGLLLVMLLLAKEWVLKSPKVTLILNMGAWLILSALFWVWLDGIFAIQEHVMGPR